MYRTTLPLRVAFLVLWCFGAAPLATLSAQPCLNIEWDVTIGGSDNDLVDGAVVLPDGRYVLAGSTNSPASGEVNEASYGPGFYDAWAVCLNPNGSIDWERRYGGLFGDNFMDVAVTLDGGLIFVGSTSSPQSGLVGQPSFSPSLPDYWVVRTDLAGNVIWEQRYGGSDSDEGTSVIVRDDGTFLVAGSSRSPVSGNKSSPLRGVRDYWVIAIDAGGNLLWDSSLGGSGMEGHYGMAPWGTGGAVLTGTSFSNASGDISQPRRGVQDIWTVAINAFGVIQWEQRHGGNNQEIPWGGVAVIEDYYFVAAQTNSPASGDLYWPSLGFIDAIGLWLDGANGNMDGLTRAGGSNFNGARSVAVLDPSTLNSNVAIAGVTDSPVSGTITGIPRGEEDYWLTIQSINNATMAQFRCGTDQWDEMRKLLITPDGGYLLAGISGADAGWDKTHDSRGGPFDLWIVKVVPTFEVFWYADADGDGFGSPSVSVLACEPPVGYVRNDRDCDDTDPTRYTGAPCTDGMGNPGVLDATCACAVEPTTITMPVVMGLEGAMDEFTGLMSDDLRDLGLLPLVEPFTMLGFQVSENSYFQADPDAFLITGTKAIVDWVLVELRSANDPSLMMASRAGLLQRDGTVVMPDGVSPFTMNAPADDYYVAVRHRNHLGVMTTLPVAVNSQTQLVDLSDPLFPVYGTDARVIKGAVACLWAGDVNGDGEVRYTGSGNDRDAVLTAVGGQVPTATLTEYNGADLNMDGTVRYTGSANDRDIVLQAIGGSVPTAVRVEQLP